MSDALSDPYERAKVVVLFRSQLTAAAGDDYAAMAEALVARASTFPGFVAIRDYTSPEGERLAVIWWEDHETLAVWREDAKHRAAQQLGRDAWYQWFHLEICDRLRASHFERP
jgi:heme-degrading monooxygenase HmoA